MKFYMIFHLVNFGEVLYYLLFNDDWITKREKHDDLSNICLVSLIVEHRKNGKEDESDDEEISNDA